MLIFTSIYSLTKGYYSLAIHGTTRCWRTASGLLTKHGGHAGHALGGIGLLTAMTILVPIVFLLPPLLGLLSAPIILPLFVLMAAADILNVIYRSAFMPAVQALFSLKPVQEVITAPARYLDDKQVLAPGWKDFINRPQDYMVSLIHNFALCALIMLPEYYCIRYLIMPGFSFMDWFWHLVLIDTGIGVALQFSPTCKLQEKLNKNGDHALIFGALNGFLCGVTQATISHVLLGTALSETMRCIWRTELDLGASATLTGCVLNMICAQVFKELFERVYDKIGDKLPSSAALGGVGT